MFIKSLADTYIDTYKKEKFEKDIWKEFSQTLEKKNKELLEENNALKIILKKQLYGGE